MCYNCVVLIFFLFTARTPLVTCLVYLLHFYKCEDKYNRVQEIRNILSKKYFYKMSDWNERKILEVFKNAILDVNGKLRLRIFLYQGGNECLPSLF